MTMTLARIFAVLTAAFCLFQATAHAAPVKLAIGSKGEEMLFDKGKLTVKAGSQVALTFKNSSTTMQHNWVLVKPGTVDAVAQGAIEAGAANGWLPKSADILANTKLLDPKKSETITFTAPKEPGEYPYVCTFPGHAALMKGVLVVTK